VRFRVEGFFQQPGTWQVAEKVLNGRCEKRFLRRGNLEKIDILDCEFVSLRSQRQ